MYQGDVYKRQVRDIVCNKKIRNIKEAVMKIKDVEKRTGITSYNIRFYEKENLLIPKRNQSCFIL